MNKRGRKPGPTQRVKEITGDNYKYYRAFIQHRNQCQFRDEEYQLMFSEWLNLYGEHLENRGRKKNQWRLERIDRSLPWVHWNVKIRQMVDKREVKGE